MNPSSFPFSSENRCYHAVVAGLACLDVGIRMKNASLPPPSTLRYFPGFTHTVGGQLTRAKVLSQMGLRTAMMARLGDDLSADILIKLMKEEAPNCENFMVKRSDVVTSQSAVYLPEDEDRSFDHNPGDLRCEDIHVAIVRQALIFLFGYAACLDGMWRNGCEQLIEMSRLVYEAGAISSMDLVMIDPDSEVAQVDWSRAFERVGPYITCLTPSIDEVPCYLKREMADVTEDDLLRNFKTWQFIADLLLDMGFKMVLLKLGKLGAYLRTANVPELGSWAGCEIMAHTYEEQNFVDALSAGDIFTAAFHGEMVRGGSIKRSLQIGHGVATSKIEGWSLGMPDLSLIVHNINHVWKPKIMPFANSDMLEPSEIPGLFYGPKHTAAK